MAKAPLIEVADALCRVGQSAVLEVDAFSIAAGEHWCLFGPNGAGKTLLARLIAGRRVESGRCVRYAAGFDPRRDCHFVGFEEQQRLWRRDNRLDISEYSAGAEDRGTTVRELILGAGTGAPAGEAPFAQLVEDLALDGILESGIRFLSSGQVRRALIARALCADPSRAHRLIVLDEPLESIDRDSTDRIDACIASHLRRGFTSLTLARGRDSIPAYATRLAVMEGLRIVAQGESGEIKKSEVFASIAGGRPAAPAAVPPPPAGHEEDAAMEDGPLIELRGVNVSYGDRRVLSDVHWTMGADEHALIEGPNGCGKSTLLSLIDGDSHKGYGQEVYLFGRRKGGGETVWDVKAKFGVVSNELHNKYVRGWKLLDVVVSGFFDSIGLYDDCGDAERDAAREWLKAFGLAELERRYYHELSFGQQQLALLARAMVKRPKVLVLDEPCVGLDDGHREMILKTIDLIARRTAARIIFVTHERHARPACINRCWRFAPVEGGGNTLLPMESE